MRNIMTDLLFIGTGEEALLSNAGMRLVEISK
jgi:hypothetical protein